LDFSENVEIAADCPDYSFTYTFTNSTGAISVVNPNWLTANTAVAHSGGLLITYDHLMAAGGYFGKRQMKDQSEDFFILVCELKRPSPYLVVDPSIVNIDESENTIASVTLNNHYMEPSNDLNQGISCFPFT
jgi:hypothetical protein